MESYRRNSCNSFSQGLISVGLNNVDMDKENNNYSKVAMAQAQLMGHGGTTWLQRTFKRSKSEYRRKHNIIQVLPSSSSSNLLQSGEEVILRNKKRCRVLFSYQPVHDDELELKADQLVEFMCEVEDGWWKGRVGGRVGVFPSNFVEMCSDERDKFQNSVEARNKKNSAGAQRSKECEIDSTKELGQKILNSSQNLTPPKPSDEGGNQMTTSERSIMGNKTPPDTAPRLPPKPVKDQCFVLFPYQAQNEDELTLEEGQTITILTQEVEDKGWWKGEVDGKVGVFPDNFVKRVSQNLSQSQIFPTEQTRDSPEKPKFQNVRNSPLKDNKRLSDEKSSSLLSKASSFEKLRNLKTSDSDKISEKIKSGSNEKLSNKINEINKADKKVSSIKNEISRSVNQVIKSEIFKVPHKVQAPKPKLGSFNSNRVSLSSIPTDVEKSGRDYQRRISEPLKSNDLDDVTTTTKLSHPTASRVKAPKRRPPSQHFLKENIPNIEAMDTSNQPIYTETSQTMVKENNKHSEEANKDVLTEDVSAKSKVVYREKPSGAVQVLPTKESSNSSESKPSWMEEFSRKKANRRSGVFGDKPEQSQESSAKPGVDKVSLPKPSEKPTPPKADTKPHILSKPTDVKTEDLAEIRKNFSRGKSQSSFAKKTESAKSEDQDIRPESSRTDRPARPSLPPSLTSSTSTNKAPELKRNSDLVRHSSELARPSSEKRHSDLSRKHSDSSRHSERTVTDKADKPAVHSTNLGKPEKFSFAKPERPLMDKVVAKNERNIAKSETGHVEVEKSAKTDNYIGWRTDILENNKISGEILANKEANGYNSVYKEKENITGSPLSKEVQELKTSLLEIQTEFQIQVKSLKKELEEEKQARMKLESEVKSLRKLVNK